MSGIELDWTEAEQLWRRSGRMDERLAMVECALAAIGSRRNHDRKDHDNHSVTPGQDRDPGRTK